ncbi:MAG TPA: hypothetical protein VLY24_03950 [Bryobacteraceae bacterium]|nr:hypothetical protein [Bryobacteraceae bacterium]
MNHLSEEELVLYYYGEAADSLPADLHLKECEACRALYGSLQRVLNAVDGLPVPERNGDYGAQVWQRIAPYLPVRSRRFWAAPPWRLAAAGVTFATLIVAAFLLGRFYPKPPVPPPIATDSQAQQRLLTLAVADYLERSEVVLIDLANASPAGSLDISPEQDRVENLITENRLYRQTATHIGDAAIAAVLDELERVLLEIEHAPSKLSAMQADELRRQLHEDGILFKMRVLDSNVRNRGENRL